MVDADCRGFVRHIPGVRGYFVDAATRIGFAPKQVLMVLLAIVVFVSIDVPLI